MKLCQKTCIPSDLHLTLAARLLSVKQPRLVVVMVAVDFEASNTNSFIHQLACEFYCLTMMLQDIPDANVSPAGDTSESSRLFCRLTLHGWEINWSLPKLQHLFAVLQDYTYGGKINN